MLNKKENDSHAEVIEWLDQGKFSCMVTLTICPQGRCMQDEDAACFNAFVQDVESGRYDKPAAVPLAVLDEMLS